MKNLLALILLIPLLSIAQTNNFCSITSGPSNLETYHTGSTTMDFITEEPLVLNIFFHDMQEIVTLEEEDYLRAVAFLNITYNQYNIFFKYRGFDFEPTPFDDMLNIHIQDIPGGTALSTSFILVSYTAFVNNKQILTHEVGHTLGLLHTFDGTSRIEMPFVNPISCEFESGVRTDGWFPVYTVDSENVTRITSDPNYNALSTGDYLDDTPAAYSMPNVCSDIDTSTSYYIFSNEVVDSEGEPYINIDVNNIMSNNEFIFLNNFTDGQAIRMRETIMNETVFETILTGVESLYEPYTGVYREWGFSQVAFDNPPLFQPGFDYEFVNCSGSGALIMVMPLPWPYDDLSFDTGDVNYNIDKNHEIYTDIVHLNHIAIRILQLDDQPRRC